MTGKYKFAFFLPTLNEENNIKKVVIDLKKYFDGYIFMVDGFSTDNTTSIAKELGIDIYTRNSPGKGSAIQKALEVAHKKNIEYLLFFDCDQTYCPSDIDKFVKIADKNDLIIGVRPLKLIKPFSRRLGNIVATGLINLGLKGTIKDSISGFKCLRVDKFFNKINEDGFVVDALICVIALKYKLKTEHINIGYNKRTGESKMGLGIGLIEFYKLVRAVIKASVTK